jgi:hypothetical protein
MPYSLAVEKMKGCESHGFDLTSHKTYAAMTIIKIKKEEIDMRRLLSCAMALCCLLSVSVNAAPNYEDLYTGETAVDSEAIIVTNLTTGVSYRLTDYSVETMTLESGDISKTVTAEINLESPETRSVVTDAGVTVRITCITTATKSGDKYRMTNFDAKYELLDSAFTISNRYVMTANYGATEVQLDTVNDYIWEYYPSTNNFSKSYSNLPWVNSVGGPSYVGGYAECDISRSSSSWHLQCRDYVVENGLF